MLTAIGFEAVNVDTSDSKMTLEVSLIWTEIGLSETLTFAWEFWNFSDDDTKVDGGDEPQEGSSERRRIHGNSAEFQHLEQHDMDQLCARVVLTGVKPQ